MLRIGNNRECFFDNFLINEEKTTAEVRLHKPVRRKVLMEFDRPWEGAVACVSPIYAAGKWRMYYVCKHDVASERSVAYAESEDAQHWVRPDLGIVEYKGSKHNNLILNNEMLTAFDFGGIGDMAIFYDERPDCEPDEKYKMILWWTGHGALGCVSSADGIHFEKFHFITDDGEFDSQNRAFWSKEHGKYFCYYRGEHEPGGDVALMDCSYTGRVANQLLDPEAFAMREPGNGEFSFMRDVRVIESTDFENWSKQQRIRYNGMDCQMYHNCVFPYPRAPHMFIAFTLRYTERKFWTKNFDELCGRRERRERAERMSRLGLAVSDGLFMSSRDGYNFTKFDEAFLPPMPENPTAFVYGSGTASPAVIEVPSEIPGADNEYMIMVRENFRNVGGCNRLVKYASRLDGFVSRHAGGESKKLVTKEFTYTGENLYANIETSARGGAYLTLKCGDESYTSCEIFGNATDKRIRFEDDAAVANLSGKPVTLEIEMFDCDIYAIKFE